MIICDKFDLHISIDWKRFHLVFAVVESGFTCCKQVAAEKERESVSRARSMSAGMPTPSVSRKVKFN